MGTSDELQAELVVRFPPRNVRTDPRELLDLQVRGVVQVVTAVQVGGSATLACEAEASPPPKLEWLQLVEGGGGQAERWLLVSWTTCHPTTQGLLQREGRHPQSQQRHLLRARAVALLGHQHDQGGGEGGGQPGASPPISSLCPPGGQTGGDRPTSAPE